MTTVNPKIAASADDGVESGAGTNAITGSTARIRDTGGGIGIRYIMCRWPLTIPNASTINSATIGGKVTTHGDDLYVVVAAESSDSAAAFGTTANDISGRTCGSTVTWNVASASITDGNYLTKDVTSIVQTVIDRAGWASGNYLALRLYNDTVEACDVTFQMYDGDASNGFQLTVDYTAPASNVAPSVNAGADRACYVGEPLALTGSYTDDGLPAPPAACTVLGWAYVSGPVGGITFAGGDNTTLTPTITFSIAGTYVLSLTVDDSSLQGVDYVTVTVSPAVGFPPNSRRRKTPHRPDALAAWSEW